jgi:hypothetical protein
MKMMKTKSKSFSRIDAFLKEYKRTGYNMNVKFAIEVSKKKLESWLGYLKDSGYEIKAFDYRDSKAYIAEVAGFYNAATPVAESVKTDRWRHWINVRIPLKN